ncbi:hypothetical protein DS565_29095 [Salmonella enterica subsp. enterica serovar Bareilly]|nr:hypothetical protein [Salmonella enterica subsp. enterica serovar Bareilly]
MKKLIIAAGIAAATMASFNASAVTYDKNNVSHASVNSVVTGSSIVTVTGQDGGSFNTTEILEAGKTLGTFDIKLPYEALGFGISGIHSHGFPDGFKVKFNNCNVEVTSNVMTRTDAALDPEHSTQECVFDNSIASVVVTTDTNTAKVAPGTKTITADFTAYTN